jgi:hypothetical protein
VTEKIESGPFMQTVSGIHFFPASPAAEQFDVRDLATGLSHYCRYGGQCFDFYSVAEHCVLVSELVERDVLELGYPAHEVAAIAFQGLWHDATEALQGDMTRPWKKIMPEFLREEAKLWNVMAPWLGVPVELHPRVMRADNEVLLQEAHVLHVPPLERWGIPAEPADVMIRCLTPGQARAEFLSRHFILRRRMGDKSLF